MITSNPISKERTDSMNYSSKYFQNDVLPILQQRYKGRWINNEAWNTETERYLDEFAGIDYLYVSEEGHVYGVCCRVIGKDGNEFSLRIARDSGTKTELQKRVEERKLGALTPFLCIQVYHSPDTLNIGICKVHDLIEMIHTREHKTAYCNNATFAFVAFNKMACLYETDMYSDIGGWKTKGIEI